MPPSLTTSQINRLGERLRKQSPPSAEDLHALQQLRAEYFEPMQLAQSRLRDELGLESTSRIKTNTTIVEKLVREKTRLSKMQDIAGLRTWGDFTLGEQTQIAERIVSAFVGSRTVDLRDEPHFGYRAFHVIVSVDKFSVEVQVRTRRQQLWAETMEKFADRFGRGLRYGETIQFQTESGKPISDRQHPVRILMRVSEYTAVLENQLDEVASARRQADQLRSLLRKVPRSESADGRKALDKFNRLMRGYQSSARALDRNLHDALKLLTEVAEGIDSRS